MSKIDNNILKFFKVGFEFEFFSKYKNTEIVKYLSKSIHKQIVIPKEIIGLNKEVVKPKSPYTPTDTKFKLVPDFSGGENMHEIVTGPLEYHEARVQLIRILKWIGENGWTTEKTGLHINISYKKDNLQLSQEMLNIDRLKFCLSFDESYIYQRFPDRKNNVYAKSIKDIYPANKFLYKDGYQVVNVGDFLMPSSKYYGVNFIKLEKNYLEFRYIGGRGYETKINSILNILEHIANEVYKISKNPTLNETDIHQLNQILSKHKKIVVSFSNFKNFLMNYPNINILVDLKGQKEIIEFFYNSHLRTYLYDLIVKCNMRKGIINYDRDVSKIQVKNAVLTNCNEISNIEFIDCKVDGILKNCDFYNTKIENSHLHDCKLFKNNKVSKSKVMTTTIYATNELESCYIDNKNTLINGKLEKCIIRNGETGPLAKLINTKIIKTDY